MADDLSESVKNQTSFSIQLTNHLFNRETQTPNLVFSPLSMHVVLSLIAAGSNGETLAQLLSFLRSQSIEELNSLSSELIASVLADGSHLDGPKICYANSVWIQDNLTLKPSFKDIVDNVYRASVNQVDFIHKADEIRGEVNSWAEKETKGLISEILPPGSVDSSTRAVIANALYFKGVWKYKFDAESTRKDDFHLLNGVSVRVPFMTSEEDQLIGSYDGFKILRLLYRQGEDKRYLSMHIILPDEKDGLPALLERVASEPGFLDRHLPNIFVPVRRFRIPKFKISFGLKAKDMLKELGLGAPFDGGLTEIVDSTLQVSEIYHKSFIEVDEEGTEAAAVTAATMVQYSLGSISPPKQPVDFVADHPFLFLIREYETGAVLFIGRVLDPSASP